MKSRITAKLIISGVVLLGALALLALGTFAWFTLSKRGDIGGIGVSVEMDNPWDFEILQADEDWTTLQEVIDSDKWSKNLTLANIPMAGTPSERTITDCYQLRPISTYDGKTWYLADYDNRGNVIGVKKATLSMVGNINRYDPTPQDQGKDVPANYVYYYDMWIKTKSDEHDYELHLNNPLNLNDKKSEDAYFGTYVLPGLVNDGNGKLTISKPGYDMCTTLRIGFLIYNQKDDTYINTKDNSGYEEPGEFWIYEPNCDLRAKYFTEFKGEADAENSYEWQKQISYLAGYAENTKVEQHEQYTDGNDIKTILPKVYRSNEDVDYDYNPNTIKQYHSSWDMNAVKSKQSMSEVNSRDVASFGKFIPLNGKEREGYTGIDTPSMVTIYRTKPQHIRVFIWMEGQDVDCWNSSLSGNLAINLEFRGEEAGS